jgi:hypothetical protein
LWRKCQNLQSCLQPLTELYMASMLSQYILFLCPLEVIQIKILLCKISHTCIIAVQFLMKILCTPVHCTAFRTVHLNCDFPHCTTTHGKEPVSLRSLDMLWNVLWCGSLWPGYSLVFCCGSHTICIAEIYSKVTLTCAPFMHVKWHFD